MFYCLDIIFPTVSSELPEAMPDTGVWQLIRDGLTNLGIVGIVCCVMFVIYKSLPKEKVRKPLWRIIDANLKWYLIIVWILGFLTYYTGSYVEGEGSLFNTVPMAIIQSFGMFLGLSDISAIRSGQHDSALFMVWFDMSHLLAIMGTFIFIIRQFGYFINASLKMQFEGEKCVVKRLIVKDRGYHDLFIFWGVNDSSISLAKSILASKKENKENIQLVFVRTFEDSDKESQQFHLGKVFDKIKMKYEEMEQLSDLECFISTSFHRLSSIKLGELEPCKKTIEKVEIEGYDILKKELEQKSLVRMIMNSKKTSFFFFGDDNDRNINATTNLLGDITVKTNDVTIYCKARKSQLTEWMEFFDLTNKEDKTTVRIIDSASIAIDGLRSDLANQPVSYVNVNSDATVSDKFEGLIVGFGNVGHDALKFLYEFSAFAGKDRRRTPFAIHVVDKDMSTIVGKFLLDNPSLTKYIDGKDERHKLEFNEMDVNESTFWNSLKSYIKNLNYVVIATGNDREQMELALTMYHYAIRERGGDLKNFCIYLYCNNGTNSLGLSNPIKFVEQTLSSTNGHIKIFGKPEDIFTYDIIIKDRLALEAKKFLDGYNSVYGEGKNWEQRREKCSTNYFDMFNLKRKENQDYANAIHMDTKLYIFETAIRQKYPGFILDADTLSKFVDMDKSGRMKVKEDRDNIHYTAPADYDEGLVNSLLRNIAITEHMRWNASHELLGYVRDDDSTSSDQINKTHNCLVEWDELDAVSTRCWEESWHTDYKYCDYVVFETTLKLKYYETK